MSLLNWLRQQVSSGRTIVQTDGEVRLLAAESPVPVWIVGRSCCIFRSLDVAAVPRSRRGKVIETQIPLLSPFATPGYWVDIQKDQAKIWIWDEGIRREYPQSHDDFTVLPEVCFSERLTDGVRIYECESGYFCHYWQGGELAGDHWWPHVPDNLSWHTYTRGLGLSGVQAPEPVRIALEQDAVWPSARVPALGNRLLENIAARAVLGVFLFFFGFQLTGTARLSLQAWQLESETAEMAVAHQESIALRDKAHSFRARSNEISRLRDTKVLDILSAVATNLPGTSMDLIQLNLENDQLEIVINDASPDLETYIRQLEVLPLLSDVSAEPLAGGVKIVAKVE